MKQTFIKGTAILIAASLISRVLGFVYRIFLTRIIGAEGIGLFQLAFPILIFIITLVTAGLPIAISKLVAESIVINARKRIRTILYLSIAIVLSLSAVFTTILIIYAPYIATKFLQDSRTYYVLMAMSPIITIAALSSIFRGYFQGLQNMNPTAISQITEQSIRIIAVIYFANLLLPKGVEYAAAGAMIGMACGELIAFLVLIIYYFNYKNKKIKSPSIIFPKKQTKRQILSGIMQTAIPVTLSKAVGSFAYALEPIVISHSLALAGIATHLATAYYGQLAGMVIPLIIFPTVFTYSLSVTLIPSISEAKALEYQKTIISRIRQSIHFTLIISVYFSIILFTQAELLARFLYNQPDIKQYLQMLAPIGILFYLQSPFAGILQGLGKAKETMYNSLTGSFLRLGGIYLLASKPELGITGAVIAIGISAITVTLLNIRSVRKYITIQYPITNIGRFCLMAVILVVVSQSISRSLGDYYDFINLFVTIAMTSGLYLIMLLFFRMISFSDLVRFKLIKRKY